VETRTGFATDPKTAEALIELATLLRAESSQNVQRECDALIGHATRYAGKTRHRAAPARTPRAPDDLLYAAGAGALLSLISLAASTVMSGPGIWAGLGAAALFGLLAIICLALHDYLRNLYLLLEQRH
jgi:hypothetical protein